MIAPILMALTLVIMLCVLAYRLATFALPFMLALEATRFALLWRKPPEPVAKVGVGRSNRLTRSRFLQDLKRLRSGRTNVRRFVLAWAGRGVARI